MRQEQLREGHDRCDGNIFECEPRWQEESTQQELLFRASRDLATLPKAFIKNRCRAIVLAVLVSRG